jgi:hypothetical protein
LTDDWTEEEAAELARLTTAWHVTSAVNRASILEHGLDWRRMGATGGIASGVVFRGPEMDAVFLCESLYAAEFFVGFGTHPSVDVWEVDVTGLVLEPGPDGWLIHRQPIPPDRVQLAQKDVVAPPPLPSLESPDATAQVLDYMVLRDELGIRPAEES